jgi:hypothetical protein
LQFKKYVDYMRLGQLARDLAMKPADIVSILGKNDIIIGGGTNTRLTNDQVDVVRMHLGLAMTDEIPPLVDDGPEDTVKSASDPEPNEVIPSTPEDITPEVIRVERVELAGLKVLGKIDLPEPKKTEQDILLEGESVQQTASRHHAREKKRLDEKKSGRRKNPIAAQREREAEALRQKKITESAAKKERRTRRYYETVTQLPPTKPVRIISDPVEKFEPEQPDTRPRTWIGRVLYWFTHAGE